MDLGQLTIIIPDVLMEALEEAGKSAKLSPTEVVLDLVRRGLAARGLREAMGKVQRELGDRAPETDEDAFGALSLS